MKTATSSTLEAKIIVAFIRSRRPTCIAQSRNTAGKENLFRLVYAKTDTAVGFGKGRAATCHVPNR
jgi:hypothetical protein